MPGLECRREQGEGRGDETGRGGVFLKLGWRYRGLPVRGAGPGSPRSGRVRTGPRAARGRKSDSSSDGNATNASCAAAPWPSSMNLDQRRFPAQPAAASATPGRRVNSHRRNWRLGAGCTGRSSARSGGERNVSILNLRTIAAALRVGLADLVRARSRRRSASNGATPHAHGLPSYGKSVAGRANSGPFPFHFPRTVGERTRGTGPRPI